MIKIHTGYKKLNKNATNKEDMGLGFFFLNYGTLSEAAVCF